MADEKNRGGCHKTSSGALNYKMHIAAGVDTLKTLPIVAVTLAGFVAPFAHADAQVRMPRHSLHHYRVVPYVVPYYEDVALSELYDPYGRPYRTVQPTNVGIGAQAPNGYVGPGTASGGPSGGLTTGGGR